MPFTSVAIPLQSDAMRGEVGPSKPRGELQTLFLQYRWRLLFTYTLFTLENVLRLAQPLLLGWAINDLLQGRYSGVAYLALGHVTHMAMRVFRQMYDTRVFTYIYAERATALVSQQRSDGVEVSTVAARSTLARQFVDFFELHVPMVLRAMYSIVGALLMLMWFDWMLVLFCAVVIIPAYILNVVYGKKTLHYSRKLHDVLEKEVGVLDRSKRNETRQHFGEVARYQVKMSDWEAMTVGLMEIFILSLIVGALLRFCTQPNIAAGDIFSVFRYVMMFVMALDAIPLLVGQTSKLKDIGARMGGKGKRKQS